MMKRPVLLAAAAATTLVLTTPPARAQSAEPQLDSRPDDASAPRPNKRGSFFGELTAGGVYGKIMGIPEYGGAVGAGIGLASDRFSLKLALDYEQGRTEHGLSTRWGGVGPSVGLVFDRLRLALGAEIAYFGLTRISNGQILDSFGVGAFALGSFDFMRFEDRKALFVQVRAKDDTTRLWGVSFSLGLRL
jgi:hypothetical protein